MGKIGGIATQFWPPRPGFTEVNISRASQAGKVFMVTGGNSGLGCEEVTEKAFKSIKDSNPETSGTGQLKFIHLDLVGLASVRTAAHQSRRRREARYSLEQWRNRGQRFPVRRPYGARSGDPHGIHCVGALLFTELLMPQLKAAPVRGTPSRVAWLTTILVDTSAPKNGVEFPSVDTGFGARMENYAASKAGVWVLCREFAKRHKVDGIISVALNPGSLETGSFRGTPRITMFLMR
ncbi:putative short-chain dehydrogenase [Seiridium cupressi]